MDLTPPSLTNSPYSPQRNSLDSPPPLINNNSSNNSGMPTCSGASYASLASLDDSCGLGSLPYGSMVDPNLSHPVDIGGPFAPLDSIPHSVAWTTAALGSAPSPPASATSNTMSNLPTDYDSFSNYESAGPCSTSEYSRAASHSPAFLHTPPPSSTSSIGREAAAHSSRYSFGFAQDQLGSRANMGDPLSYNSAREASRYPPGVLATSGHLSRTHLAPGGHGYLGGGIHPQAQAQSPMPTGIQPHTPDLQVMPPQPRQSPALSDASSGSLMRVKKPRQRPVRRHTTKEEANFQCTVRGCGKFFSRSYNFKSHMETHDDNREYPFPCQVQNCTKKFVRKTDLQRHHQSVHAKERNHRCDYCGRLFARKDTLRRFVLPTSPPKLLTEPCFRRHANLGSPGIWKTAAPRGSKSACSTAPPIPTA